jgi:hypothetical protein
LTTARCSPGERTWILERIEEAPDLASFRVDAPDAAHHQKRPSDLVGKRSLITMARW